MTYTKERITEEALEWNKFVRDAKRKRKQCNRRECEFEGKRYPSISAAVRAMGHTQRWLELHGLVLL